MKYMWAHFGITIRIKPLVARSKSLSMSMCFADEMWRSHIVLGSLHVMIVLAMRITRRRLLAVRWNTIYAFYAFRQCLHFHGHSALRPVGLTARLEYACLRPSIEYSKVADTLRDWHPRKQPANVCSQSRHFARYHLSHVRGRNMSALSTANEKTAPRRRR